MGLHLRISGRQRAAGGQGEYVKSLSIALEHPILKASNALAKAVSIEFDAFLPSEIGSGNTIANVFVAA